MHLAPATNSSTKQHSEHTVGGVAYLLDLREPWRTRMLHSEHLSSQRLVFRDVHLAICTHDTHTPEHTIASAPVTLRTEVFKAPPDGASAAGAASIALILPSLELTNSRAQHGVRRSHDGLFKTSNQLQCHI